MGTLACPKRKLTLYWIGLPIGHEALDFGNLGRVFHRQISPIKSGPQPIVTAQGRIRGRMPIVLPLSVTGRSDLGKFGLGMFPVQMS